MQPYFYILQNKETGQYYGGASWGKNPKPILTEYHTSSDVVRSMGIDKFILRKIKNFDTDAEAQRYEHRFLFKVKAASNANWLNMNYGNTPMQTGKTWWNNGTKSTLAYVCPEGYKKGRILNKTNIGKYQKTEEQKQKIAETLKGNIPWNKGLKGTHVGHKKFTGKTWNIENGKRVWRDKD